MSAARREVSVRVPASSANLGPGFDTLGLALARYDEVQARTADDGLVVEVAGEEADRVPRDERHLVVRAMRMAFATFGETPPGLRVRCHNTVPHSRGLGSSAAAAVSGVVAAAALLGRDVDAARAELLQLAAVLEGHADNAAASLYGGFVVAWNNDGAFDAVRLEPHPDLRPVALISAEKSSTHKTRGLLPDRVPLADAAFTASRTGLAVGAFAHHPELLLAATEDRLHQPYRRCSYPASAALMDRLREHGIPAVVSGAGPTVLAFPSDGRVPTELVGPGFTASTLQPDLEGVVVRSG